MLNVEELCENVCIIHEVEDMIKGLLHDIKSSYGKKNLIINGNMSLEFLQNHPGVTRYKQLTEGCELQIENEDVSQTIFSALQGKGFIRKFALEEPSLNDIFIEKVGASYE